MSKETNKTDNQQAASNKQQASNKQATSKQQATMSSKMHTPCLPSYMVKLFLDTCKENFVVKFVKKNGSICTMECRPLGYHQQPWSYWNASRQEYVQSWAPYYIRPWRNGQDTCVVSCIPSAHRGDDVANHYRGYTSKKTGMTSETGGFKSFNMHRVISINTSEAWETHWEQKRQREQDAIEQEQFARNNEHRKDHETNSWHSFDEFIAFYGEINGEVLWNASEETSTVINGT